MTPSIRPVAMISVRTERHHLCDIAVRLEKATVEGRVAEKCSEWGMSSRVDFSYYLELFQNVRLP